jgi:hypothetical protein
MVVDRTFDGRPARAGGLLTKCAKIRIEVSVSWQFQRQSNQHHLFVERAIVCMNWARMAKAIAAKAAGNTRTNRPNV